MTPLLWFLMGACFGAFLGVVIMAMLISSADADRAAEAWEHNPTPEPQLDDIRRRDGIPTRRGPYNWEQE